MINSRNTVYFQWGVIIVLLLLYWTKAPVCPEVKEKPSRTVYITYHDTVPKTDSVAPVKTGSRKRFKNLLVAPPANYAQDTTVGVDTTVCDVYTAHGGDSLVDIDVSFCSSDPVQDFAITYRHKGVKQIQIIDSVPYPVGFRRGLYAGVEGTTAGGFGPKLTLYNPKTSYSYSYDAVHKVHSVGVGVRVWGR